MKKSKTIISGVVNWFKMKHDINKLIQQKEELTNIINAQQEVLEAYKDVTDKYVHLEELEQLKKSYEHELKLKHKIKDENKELREKLKESKYENTIN